MQRVLAAKIGVSIDLKKDEKDVISEKCKAVLENEELKTRLTALSETMKK